MQQRVAIFENPAACQAQWQFVIYALEQGPSRTENYRIHNYLVFVDQPGLGQLGDNCAASQNCEVQVGYSFQFSDLFDDLVRIFGVRRGRKIHANVRHRIASVPVHEVGDRAQVAAREQIFESFEEGVRLTDDRGHAATVTVPLSVGATVSTGARLY